VRSLIGAFDLAGLTGSKKAYEKAFSKQNSRYPAVRWHRRLYGRDVADADMLNTAFLLTKSLLEFHTDQVASLASWRLFPGVPVLNSTIDGAANPPCICCNPGCDLNITMQTK
jgi:hypothetical protein